MKQKLQNSFENNICRPHSEKVKVYSATNGSRSCSGAVRQTERANSYTGRKLSLRPQTLAYEERPQAALVCRFMVSTSVIYVIT